MSLPSGPTQTTTRCIESYHIKIRKTSCIIFKSMRSKMKAEW